MSSAEVPGEFAEGLRMPLSARARRLLARAESLAGEPSLLAKSAIPSEAVRSAVVDALKRGETHYTDRPGVLELRAGIAEKLTQRFGMRVDAEADLVVTCGVTEARFIAAQQLLAPGAVVAAPVHGERIEGAALLRRAQLVTVMDAEASALYLASSMGGAECREKIAAAPEQASILYEIDDSVSAFHPAQAAGCAGRTTTIGALGTDDWQIGYLASPPAASAGMRDFKMALTICSTSLSQWALLAALKAGEVAL